MPLDSQPWMPLGASEAALMLGLAPERLIRASVAGPGCQHFATTLSPNLAVLP